MIRTFAANLNLKYENVDELTQFARKFVERTFVERRWGHLNDCQPYCVDSDLKTILPDNPNGIFINRFNMDPVRKDLPEWDYFGMRGMPLFEMLPEWKEKVRMFNEMGLSQLVDSPCILITNRRVVMHRDARPSVPGYSSRQVGINYLLFNDSVYDTGVWADTEKTLANQFSGLEYTKPSALIKYDKESMNMVNTSLPHGSYIDSNIAPPPELAPRAFVTMGFKNTYMEVREKVGPLVKFDW